MNHTHSCLSLLAAEAFCCLICLSKGQLSPTIMERSKEMSQDQPIST